MRETNPYAVLLALLVPAAAGLAGCGQESVACVQVADDAAECAPPSGVDKDELFGSCGAKVKRVTGPGELRDFLGFGSVPIDSGNDPGQQCCYPVVETKATCVYGRPYVVNGEALQAGPQAGDSWVAACEPCVDGLAPEARELLALAWSEAALDEHAAVAAFGKVALELLSLGAPPELVAATHGAALEEIEHARLGFALASAYAGAPMGPDGFPFGGTVGLAQSLTELAVATAREGCIGETLTALVIAEVLVDVQDPVVRSVMTRILAEEQGHAALAWRTVRWAIEAGGAPVRDAVAAVFAEALQGVPLPMRLADGPHRDALVAHGIPDSVHCGRALRRGLAEVVGPASQALLFAPSEPSDTPRPAAR